MLPLLLLDDGRVSSERRAGPSATYLDPETIEEVEVVRGPAGILWGTNAVHGVVNIITKAGFRDNWGLVDVNSGFMATPCFQPSRSILVTNPDLLVSNITLPLSLSSGTETQLEWTVANVGTGATQSSAWTDAAGSSGLA